MGIQLIGIAYIYRFLRVLTSIIGTSLRFGGHLLITEEMGNPEIQQSEELKATAVERSHLEDVNVKDVTVTLDMYPFKPSRRTSTHDIPLTLPLLDIRS